MRPITFVAALLALAACGAPSEPTVDNDNAGHHAGGETPAPCVERPSTATLAGLDGRWFLVEPGGDDVEMVMDLSGGVGSAWADDPSERMPVRVVPRDDALTELELGAPSGDGPVMRVFFAPRGPGSALAFTPGDDDARIARRATDVPAFLQGQWVIADPRGRRDSMQLAVEGDHASLIGDREERTVELFGLEPDGPTIDLVGRRMDRERSDFEWLRLQRVSPGVLLVREGDEDEFRVMHRPGAEPAWLAETRRPAASGPSAPPPSVTEIAPAP